MKFAFITTEGLTLTWWLRLLSEGHEVRIYHVEPHYRLVGKGLVDQAESIYALRAWGGKDAIYVFDFSGKGQIADQMRKQGYKVFGSGAINDRLEKDRRWADDVAKMVGLRLPHSLDFKSIDDAIKQAKGIKDPESGWYFKSDKYLEGGATYGAKSVEDLVKQLEHIKKQFGNNISGIIQEKLSGVVLSTMWWWNGERMMEPFVGMLENKKVWNDDLGPNVGCAINLVWAYSREPRIARLVKLDTIEQLFARLKLPPGEYDVNEIINEKDKLPYFLEWGPRTGYDEDLTYLAGMNLELGAALAGAVSQSTLLPLATDEYWLGIRLSVPPYPWEHLDYPAGGNTPKHSSIASPFDGAPDLIGERFAPYSLQKTDEGLQLGGPDGLLGVALSQGTSLRGLHKDALAVAKRIAAPNLQYRTDALEYMTTQMRLLKGWGYANEMPEYTA